MKRVGDVDPGGMTSLQTSHHSPHGLGELINRMRADASGAFVCWRLSLLFTCCSHVNIYCKRAHLLSSHPWLLPSPPPSLTPVLPGELARRLGYPLRCMTFADCRQQIADCKLNDTKNLPNKGDVFKNIKSCESEKVALGTRLIFLCKSYIGLIPKMLLAILHRPFINSSGISLIALILYSSLIIVNW